MPGRFSSSSQSAHWLLTRQQIDELRAKTRRPPAPAPQTGATPGLSNIMLSPFPDAPTNDGAAAEGMIDSPMIRPPEGEAAQLAGGRFRLSEDEAAVLRMHHELRLRQICDAMKERGHFVRGKAMGQTEAEDNMASTACTYFKRYFLHRAMEDSSPTAIMLAAIYTATKVEEVWFERMMDEMLKECTQEADLLSKTGGATGGARGVPADPKVVVVEHEMLLLSVLQFHLVVYHPYRPLRAQLAQFKLWHEAQMQEKNLTSMVGHREVEKFYKAAVRKIHRGYCVDLPLLYPPTQIAVGALLMVAQQPGSGDQQVWKAVQADLLRFVNEELLGAASATAAGAAAGAAEGARVAVQEVPAQLREADAAVRRYTDNNDGAKQADQLKRKLLPGGYSDGASSGGEKREGEQDGVMPSSAAKRARAA